MSTVTKTIRKAGKIMRRILPVKVKTSGWVEDVLQSYGPSSGMRNWIIAEQPVIEPKSANADNTMYTFKKPVKVYVRGKVLSERDGKIFMEIDPANTLLPIIEDYVLENGGKNCLIDYGVPDNWQTRSKLVWEKEGKHCVTLKSKWFEGRYTKPYLNGETTTSMPATDELELEIILQLYGLWGAEDKSAYGVLAGVSAYNLLTE